MVLLIFLIMLKDTLALLFPNLCITTLFQETSYQSWVDYLQIVIRYWFQITWQKL